MPLDFPSSPANGQTYGNYYYDSSIGAWRNLGSKDALSQRITALETFDTNSVGLKNVSPSTVTIATGSGSFTSTGLVSFTGATAVSLNGVFTSQYANYRVIVTMSNSTVTGPLTLRYRANGTDYSVGNYYQGGMLVRSTNTSALYVANNDNCHYLLEYVGTAAWGHAVVDIIKPNVAAATSFTFISMGHIQSVASFDGGGLLDVGNVFDGFTIYPKSGGTIAGTVQVFGYND